MTRLRVQAIPGQWHGVESDSDHLSRERVGSDSMAALRARRERPSGLRDETSEVKKNRNETTLGSESSILFLCVYANASLSKASLDHKFWFRSMQREVAEEGRRGKGEFFDVFESGEFLEVENGEREERGSWLCIQKFEFL